jgi:hypothetical protein
MRWSASLPTPSTYRANCKIQVAARVKVALPKLHLGQTIARDKIFAPVDFKSVAARRR